MAFTRQTRQDELDAIERFKTEGRIKKIPAADPDSISLSGFREKSEDRKRRGRPKKNAARRDEVIEEPDETMVSDQE